jgi:hypothetical protein
MGKQPAEKEKTPKLAKPEKPEKPDKPGPAAEVKGKPKKGKPGAEGAVEQEKDRPKAEKPKPPPRPPVDLRLKVLKKFYGKFLPKGPLRLRHNALMERWNSGENHGGVTIEELKSLYDDWKTARAKPARLVRASR